MKKKRIAKAFAGITVPEDLKKKVMSATVFREKREMKQFRPAVVAIVLAICLGISVSVVYAEEIKEWYISVVLKNGELSNISNGNPFKKIPEDVLKVGMYEPLVEMSYEEVEKMLESELLKFDEENLPMVYYGTSLNEDGSIGRVELWIPEMKIFSKERDLSMSALIFDEDAFIGLIDPYMQGEDPIAGSEVVEQYDSKGLGVTVALKTYDNAKRLEAAFVYEEVFYRLIGHNMTLEEMKDAVEQLHF